MKNKNWIIINLITRKPFNGFAGQPIRFSSEENAIEVAEQIFESHKDYTILNIEYFKL